MRPTAYEQRTIAESVFSIFPPDTGVSLFGSRVDDTKRGGDIDLLVETPFPLEPSDLVQRRGALIALCTNHWKSNESMS